jgi:hypothetical protein
MTRLSVPAAAVAAAAAIAIVTAGCASAGASGPGSSDSAASLAPSNSVAFLAAGTDLGSSKWHGLWQPFMQRFASVEPALGDELDVAVLPGKQIVGFTQPRDEAKLAALAKKRGLLTRAIGDWTAISKSSAALNTVASATSHLADNNVFNAAMASLPDNALARAYASPAAAQQLLSAVPGAYETSAVPNGVHYRLRALRANETRTSVATSDLLWAAAALTSVSDGLKLQAFAKLGGISASGPPRYVVHPTPPYVPGLIDEIPSGALGVVDLMVGQGMFENMPKLPTALTNLVGAKNAQQLPIQLDTLLGGETAIYVRPSLPTPEVTLVTQPADTAAASQALDQIIAELPPSSMLSGVKLYRTTIGGQFVVSTTQQGLDDFRGGGAKLASDPNFVAARKSVGMGDETTGFVYGDLKDALPMLQLAGVKLPKNLPPLGLFMAYGGGTTGESSLTAFLGVG